MSCICLTIVFYVARVLFARVLRSHRAIVVFVYCRGNLVRIVRNAKPLCNDWTFMSLIVMGAAWSICKQTV